MAEQKIDELKISEEEANAVRISNSADRPNAFNSYRESKKTAADVKKMFDAPFELLREKHDKTVDELRKYNAAESEREAAETEREEAETKRANAEQERKTAEITRDDKINDIYEAYESGKLKGDKGDKGDPGSVNVVQTPGDSETDAMSQKATTDAIDLLATSQKICVFGGDFSGENNIEIKCNIPAGSYNLHIDSIESLDTDKTTSVLIFVGGGVTISSHNLERNTPIDLTLVFSSPVDTIRFYASTSWDMGKGDTFGFNGLKIIGDTVLNKRIVKLEEAALSQDGMMSDIADIRNNIMKEATPVYDKYAGTSYILPSGEFLPLNGFSVSDPIEIPEGAKQVHFIGVTAQEYIASLAFFDTDNPEGKTALSVYKCTEYLDEYTYIDIPDGATHLFTCKKDSHDLSNARYYFTFDIIKCVEDVELLREEMGKVGATEISNQIFETADTVEVAPSGQNGDVYPNYVTSTFSGWKGVFQFDSTELFNSVTIPIQARDTAITQIAFVVEVGGVKYTKTIDVTVEAKTMVYVTCTFDEKISITAGEQVSIGYACNAFCDVISQVGSVGGALYYKTNGDMNINSWSNADKESFALPLVRINAKRFGSGKEENRKVLHLPKKYDLVLGDNFELFYKGIFNALNPERFDFEITINTGNYGYGFKRKYTWTPTAANVGQHTMTITVRDDNGDVVDSGTVILNVVNQPTTPTSNKVVLCIGDSLTDGGTWCAEFFRRLTANNGSPVGYGLSNIQFIGEKTKDGANYVGYGGWNFNLYLNESKFDGVMHIYGAFNKTDSDQHSVYKDANGVQWKLETIGASAIKIIRVSSSGTLPTSGTLTWVSGGVNTNAINYTSSEQAAGNPFWNTETNEIDFAWYAAQKGVNSIDYCNILLGWNSTYETEESYKSQVRAFLDKLLSAFPNCKVSLMGLQVPSRDGFAQNYGVSWKYYDKLQWVWTISKWYAEIAEESAYVGKVEYVNISGQFDTDNNMYTSTVQVNNRNTATEVRQSNGVHPAESGYLQIADAALRNFAAKI